MSRRLARAGLIALYSFVLLLALRFCGRTYPGWYFPDSNFLNGLLNSNFLFTELGYELVVLGATAGTAHIFMASDSPRRTRLRWWLGAAQAAAVVLVIPIISYGFLWAHFMQRLPWQPDGGPNTYML